MQRGMLALSNHFFEARSVSSFSFVSYCASCLRYVHAHLRPITFLIQWELAFRLFALRSHAAAPLICASCVFPREHSEPVPTTDLLLIVCATMRSDLQADSSFDSSQLRCADLVPVHKAPVTINVDKHILKLGDTSHTCGPT